jgi:signal transduction histidine kinase
LPGDGSVLQRSISETAALQLSYQQNVFSLSWAAMDFVLQDKVQYECKLEGYDAGWRNLGLLNSVDYTRVPQGKYLFRVRISNPELKELSSERSLLIEVLPPVWKTWWAYVLYFVLTLVLLEITRRTVSTILQLRNKVLIEKELADIKLNFFTNVSHELRTPLTLILGPAKELRENEKLTDKGLAYARLIEQNGERLLRQVNHLLDFRKVQKGKMVLQLTEIDLVPFIKTVCQNFEDLALRRQIYFEVVCDTPDNEIIIEVIDNGKGISKSQEKNLFEAFTSHYGEASSSQTGTGIGLALSRQLVLMHGGRLAYRPTPSGGATFSICLKGRVLTEVHEALHMPYEPEALSVMPSSLPDKENTECSNLPSILIVEDNDDLRTFLRLQLACKVGRWPRLLIRTSFYPTL